MGRELRRVPLDFDWPLNKVWVGFINPHYKVCPENDKTCFNGATSAGTWLSAFVQLIQVAASDGLDGGTSRARGGIWPHPYLADMPNAPRQPAPNARSFLDRQVIPVTKEFTDLYLGLTESDAKTSFELSSGTLSWRLHKKLVELAGVPETWGECPVCEGSGKDPASRAAYEAWEPTEPPKGPGWQLWETVSEGSPISKVYATREAFLQMLLETGYSRKSAEAFCVDGWVPSAVAIPGVGMFLDIHSASLPKSDDSKPAKED